MKYAARLISILGIHLILVLSLVLSLPSTVVAAPGDETSSPQLTLYSTIENISVMFSFSGDNNADNQASLYYKQSSASEWTPGIEMTADRRDTLIQFDNPTIANPYNNQWRAVIFGLSPTTSYDVRVVYSDADGGSGSVESSISTRDNNPPSSGSTYYVATSGSDSSGDGSSGNPWQTVSHAATMVSPGDTVRIRPGTYNEQVVLSVSGTADNYITFTSDDPANKAVISAARTNGTFHLLGTDYVRLQNLDIRATANDSEAVRIASDAVGNIVEGCDISSTGVSWWAGGVWLLGNGYEHGPSYTIIQSNNITTAAEGTNGPFGVMHYSLDIGGTVIRNNVISGGFYDGIAIVPNFNIGSTGHNYIYGNSIDGANDDCIEAESGGMNSAIWNNTLSSGNTMGLGVAPVIIGPMYIFRNTYYTTTGQAAVKMGSSSYGFVYFYHNTIIGRNSILAGYGSNNVVANTLLRNNIFQCYGGSQYVVEIGSTGTGYWNSDYNSIFSARGTCIKWLGTAITWSDWRDSYGNEPNGLWGDSLLTNPAGGDLTLQPTSPCIDQGVVIPGFNDANSPWPYYGSAPDIGAFERTPVDEDPGVAPYLSGHSPANNATDVMPFTDIVVHVKDDGIGVNQSTIAMSINGTDVTGDLSIIGTSADYTVTYNPPSNFAPGARVNVTVEADDADPIPAANHMSESYSFTISSHVNDPPILDPIGPKEVDEGVLLEFTVNATDPDGWPISPLVYEATNLPDGASFNPTTHTFSWTPTGTQAGVYSDLVFRVFDGIDFDEEQITITVNNTINTQPVADAGPDQAVKVSSLVTLDGSGSYDPDSDPLDYLWAQTSGPSVTLSDDTAVSPTFTPSEISTYVFSLVVDDGTVPSDADTVTITVNANSQPVADAGPDQTVTVSSPVTLDGSGSSDPDSDPLDYLWTQTSGPSITLSDNTSASPTFTPSEAGSYVFSLVVDDGELPSDADTVTITVNTGGSGGDDGDTPAGGGGGGGSAGVTSIAYSITSSGRFIEEVTAKSSDGNVILTIAKETVGLNSVNQPFMSIRIKERDPQPPDPENGCIIGLAYDIAPDGAYFDPAIGLTFKYEDGEIPEGVNEGNLLLATYDWKAKEWYTLEMMGVDTWANTVSAKLSHFSTYAVIAYTRPAGFTVTDMSASPQEIETGTDTTISALVTNTGDLAGFYDVCLTINGQVVDTEEVALEGGQSEEVSFVTTPDSAGDYEACIGETTVLYTVADPKTPAAFSASELTISPAEIELGDSVEVSIIIVNSGELSGDYNAVLMLNDIAVQNEEVTLAGGESVTVTFSMTPETTGEYSIAIGGQTASLEIAEAAAETEDIAAAPEISRFNVTPIYDIETGKLVSARVFYEINDPATLSTDAEIMLSVFCDGECLEEIPLLTLSQLEAEGNTGILGYVPSMGWSVGNYTFQAELTDRETCCQSPEEPQFVVTPETVTKIVSWKTLGIVIGSMFVVVIFTVALVLYRRRDMLRDYTR